MSGAPTSETTGSQQKPQLFKPGQSGNPAGRPKGARHKLGSLFLENMLKDFAEHGEEVISKVRETDPTQYVKVVASILPKEIEAGEELAEAINQITRRIIDTASPE